MILYTYKQHTVKIKFITTRHPLFDTKDLYNIIGKKTKPQKQRLGLYEVIRLLSKKKHTTLRSHFIRTFTAWLAPKETAARLYKVASRTSPRIVLDENDVQNYLLTQVNKKEI